MTGREIVNAAEVYVGKSIETNMALIAINEAMRVIADMGLVYGTISLNGAKSGEWKKLPNNLTHVLRVYDNEGNTFEGWEEIGGAIRVFSDGDFTIQARKIPNKMIDLGETPDINDGFHTSIVRFVREFALQAKAEDPAYKFHNFDAFKEEVMKTNRYLNRRRNPKQIRVIRHA